MFHNPLFIPFCHLKHTTKLMPDITPLKSDSVFFTRAELFNDFYEAIQYVAVSFSFLDYAFGIEYHRV